MVGIESQEALRAAVLKVKALAEEAKTTETHTAQSGEVSIRLGQSWLGIEHCAWPHCVGDAHQTAWIVSRGEMKIQIWELAFHYAEAGHLIDFSVMSEDRQETLLKIFGE